jgi:hypothetical protein
MVTKENDGLDSLLFGDGRELVDFKCFRGDREDVSAADIKEQIHSALMQKRMNRATMSETPPRPDVARVNVREFVKGLVPA